MNETLQESQMDKNIQENKGEISKIYTESRDQGSS
jgi:hypothetical protein